MTKYEKPGAKAPHRFWRSLPHGLKAMLPRINAGAPTPSSHVNSESPLRDNLGALPTLAKGKCGRYKDWLTDASLGELGADCAPELLAHAAECDACREAYNHARELSDFADQIDRGVESLVSGEPSPHFNSRLLARIAAEAATPRFNWLAWTPIAAGSTALAIVLIVFFTRTQRPNSPPVVHNSNVPAARTSPPNTEGGPMISAANRQTVLPSHSRKHSVRSARPHPEPEVLVEPGQLEAAMQLADSLRSGRVDGPKLIAAQQRFEAPLEIKPIEITPISPPESNATDTASANETFP